MKKISLFFCLLLTLSSCSNRSSSFLEDKSCNAPCWRGIEPGETSKDDVLSKVKSMKDIIPRSVNEVPGNYKYWQNGITWKFTGTNEKIGSVFFHDDKVIFIDAYYDKKLLLSDIISQYGNPTQVRATYERLETTVINISLVYTNGICVSLNMKKDNYIINEISNIATSTINPSTIVDRIYYFDPNIPAEQLDTPCYWPIESSKIQKWKGYSEYKLFIE
jgi:hypothetical protein